MDDFGVLGREEGRDVVQRFLAQYDAPAYVRRACQVEDALDQLLARCRQKREPWLATVRLRLGTVRALVGDGSILRPLLADGEQVAILERLYADLDPRLRAPVAPTLDPCRCRRALEDLCQSIERFNRRWLAFLGEVDLGPLNELRDGYNRYYVLEKECAVRSPRLARQGFRRLPPLTTADLIALLPPLPLPRLAG